MNKDKTGVRELPKMSTEAFVAEALGLALMDEEVTSTVTDNAGGRAWAISIDWNEAVLLPIDGEKMEVKTPGWPLAGAPLGR